MFCVPFGNVGCKYLEPWFFRLPRQCSSYCIRRRSIHGWTRSSQSLAKCSLLHPWLKMKVTEDDLPSKGHERSLPKSKANFDNKQYKQKIRLRGGWKNQFLRWVLEIWLTQLEGKWPVENRRITKRSVKNLNLNYNGLRSHLSSSANTSTIIDKTSSKFIVQHNNNHQKHLASNQQLPYPQSCLDWVLLSVHFHPRL